MGLKAACERSPHLRSWVLTITSYPLVIFLVLGPIMLPVLEGWWFYAIFCFGLSITLLFQIKEILDSDSKEYLWNYYKKEDYVMFLESIRESHPTIEWQMEC